MVRTFCELGQRSYSSGAEIEGQTTTQPNELDSRKKLLLFMFYKYFKLNAYILRMTR